MRHLISLSLLGDNMAVLEVNVPSITPLNNYTTKQLVITFVHSVSRDVGHQGRVKVSWKITLVGSDVTLKEDGRTFRNTSGIVIFENGQSVKDVHIEVRGKYNIFSSFVFVFIHQ